MPQKETRLDNDKKKVLSATWDQLPQEQGKVTPMKTK